MQIVDCLPDVALRNDYQCLESLRAYLHILLLDDVLEVKLHLAILQFLEFEQNTPALDWYNQFSRVIATQHEPSIVAIADYHPQSLLCALSQTIRLVKNHNFGFSSRQIADLLRELFDFVPNHVNSFVVRSIHFLHSLGELIPKDGSSQAEDGGCLPDFWQSC